ncbi:MAG: hypothetical protein IJW90_03215 [Clostridia bacterium]|nr:hypothetical protein [Clostridia bacterium]
MKQRRISLLLICAALLTAILCALPMGVFAATEPQAKKTDLPRPPYIFSVDEVTGGSGFSAASMLYVYEDFSLADDQPLTLKGWIATDEGIKAYEYAWVSGMHRTPEWTQVTNLQIVPRGDLKNAGIPYEAGHESAGFSLTIQPDASLEDGYYDLYVRAISGDGVGLDIVMFPHLCYGEPDRDNGETRVISFPRIAKTPGALTNASVHETGLVMTNTSFAALGQLELSAFSSIRVTYSLSKAYTDGKQAILGFKSSAAHSYGNGKDRYNLTDHVVALPLHTETTDMQTVELDLDNVSLPPCSAPYLAAYLADGISLTIHDITLTYRGHAYDHTAAKIYFSEDTVPHFQGINRVELKGVSDPVMGDVLRIEITEETNDPFTHFNAAGLFKNYDLRLNADHYKYMVVLARANSENLHANMTFYLCAGTIYGATEACTYTHTLTRDGKWHYYLFDLTDKENWTGNINGWRFDIISGDSLPGNYVDFASIQLFSTLEAAQKASSASVSTGITPHQLGMPILQRHDDLEHTDSLTPPVIFEDGDWFEIETETESVTEPETKPLPDPETDLEIQTPAPEAPDTSDATQTSPEASNPSVTDPSDETQAAASGCASTISVIYFAFPLSLILIMKKKKENL